MIALLLLGCGTAPGKPDTADTQDTSTPEDTAPDGPVALTDASNYSYTAALEIGESPIAVSASSYLDWSKLTRDLRGGAVNPEEDVRGVNLVWFRDLAPDAVETGLIDGSITQASVGLFATASVEGGITSMPLEGFDLYGTPFDPATYMTVEGGAWLVRISTVTNSEAMVHFLLPSDAPTGVELDDASATLAFDPDLASLTPIRLTADTVEWSGLTRDARGAALDQLALQELWIARYDGYDVPTLQSRFFELESLAAATWTLNVYGEDGADLREAVDADGAAFTGIDRESTWLLALRCIICTSPAPVYLTVLTPE